MGPGRRIEPEFATAARPRCVACDTPVALNRGGPGQVDLETDGSKAFSGLELSWHVIRAPALSRPFVQLVIVAHNESLPPLADPTRRSAVLAAVAAAAGVPVRRVEAAEVAAAPAPFAGSANASAAFRPASAPATAAPPSEYSRQPAEQRADVTVTLRVYADRCGPARPVAEGDAREGDGSMAGAGQAGRAHVVRALLPQSRPAPAHGSWHGGPSRGLPIGPGQAPCRLASTAQPRLDRKPYAGRAT
jgi:hypothetical protein